MKKRNVDTGFLVPGCPARGDAGVPFRQDAKTQGEIYRFSFFLSNSPLSLSAETSRENRKRVKKPSNDPFTP